MTTPFDSDSTAAVSLAPAAGRVRASSLGDEVTELDAAWQVAGCDPGQVLDVADLELLEWLPARVPGTVAGAFRMAGREVPAIDDREWWFRTTFDGGPAAPGERVVLALDGLATIADVFLNGARILQNGSMFARHRIDVGALLAGRNELLIRFAAFEPLLAIQRRPRPRWRTRLVSDNNLRWIRTMLAGRIPSLAAGPAPCGPWRPIRLERRAGFAIDALDVRARVADHDGVVTVEGRATSLGGTLGSTAELEVIGPGGSWRDRLEVAPDRPGARFSGAVRIPSPERWWPHTHGTPTLHAVRLHLEHDGAPRMVDAGRVGFRTVAPGATPDHDIDRDGLRLHLNGVPIFARGAVWTPLDIIGLAPATADLRRAIELAAAAGMNILRLPGFGAYEVDEFHDLCDELGMLVWQDLMFASLDYPFEDEAFGRQAVAEADDIAHRLAAHPSSAILCGNSEVEQQVAMLGLDASLARIPFYDSIVPRIAADAGLDAPYVPSSCWGGDLPMQPDRGVTGYFGVGGYGQPLSDARTSGLRFASECLAFANVPDEDALADLVPEPPGEAMVHHPRWKAGVVRDAGRGWDFDDIRDLYLELVFGLDPRDVRRADHDRYLELSRAVTGEVMARAFGEWRRAASPCGGAMTLWLRDLVPGAGFGVLDSHGEPKTAYFHLRRALAPVAVWLTDEHTGGIVAHVANDRSESLAARLRVAVYTDHELQVGEAEVRVEVGPHGSTNRNVEAVLGSFVDAAWVYRFGPPAQDVIAVSLYPDEGPDLLSQAFHFPAGRPLSPEPARRLGLVAVATPGADGAVGLEVTTRRIAYGVRVHAAGFRPSDDGFSVEPGGRRHVLLQPHRPDVEFDGGSLTALNLAGRVAITLVP